MSEKKGKVHKRLTIAELKNCKGFDNYTDQQAEQTIATLEKLSVLFYNLYIKHQQEKGKDSVIKNDSNSNERKINSRERNVA